jgi:hypothetical protein
MPGKVMFGKPLLDLIGPFINDAMAQNDEEIALELDQTFIRDERDIDDLPYVYIEDFFKSITPEYYAWRNGMTKWLSRVYITSERMIMIGKREVANGVPSRVAILDATGSAELYYEMFSKNDWIDGEYKKISHGVDEYKLNVKTKGSIYQVARRLNGISTMAKKEKDTCKLLSNGYEELDIIKRIVTENGYENPGCVTFMGVEKTDEYHEYFRDNILHFYGQRGSNTLENCDALFVVGAPTPPYPDMEQVAKCLDMNRWQPFATQEIDGTTVPVRVAQEMPYQVYRSEDGEIRQAYRLTWGAWNDQLMRTVETYYREDEIVQALHRCRPILHECDVWLLTNIPTRERLAQIFDDPGEVFGAPSGFDWRAWCKAVDWGLAHPGELVGYTRIERYNIIGLDEITGIEVSWLKEKKVLHRLIETGHFMDAEIAIPTGGRMPKIIKPTNT